MRHRKRVGEEAGGVKLFLRLSNAYFNNLNLVLIVQDCDKESRSLRSNLVNAISRNVSIIRPQVFSKQNHFPSAVCGNHELMKSNGDSVRSSKEESGISSTASRKAPTSNSTPENPQFTQSNIASMDRQSSGRLDNVLRSRLDVANSQDRASELELGAEQGANECRASDLPRVPERFIRETLECEEDVRIFFRPTSENQGVLREIADVKIDTTVAFDEQCHAVLFYLVPKTQLTAALAMINVATVLPLEAPESSTEILAQQKRKCPFDRLVPASGCGVANEPASRAPREARVVALLGGAISLTAVPGESEIRWCFSRLHDLGVSTDAARALEGAFALRLMVEAILLEDLRIVRVRKNGACTKSVVNTRFLSLVSTDLIQFPLGMVEAMMSVEGLSRHWEADQSLKHTHHCSCLKKLLYTQTRQVEYRPKTGATGSVAVGSKKRLRNAKFKNPNAPTSKPKIWSFYGLSYFYFEKLVSCLTSSERMVPKPFPFSQSPAWFGPKEIKHEVEAALLSLLLGRRATELP